jgi:8-oxo-dGTP pyrophosphatase MutT (NUDIX family)
VNTGFRDGEYDTPSGHVVPNEEEDVAAARELEEETGLIADRADMDLFHVRTNEVDTPDMPYKNFFFRIARVLCQGEFGIREPNKCDDMGMYKLDALPEPTNPHVKAALANLTCTQVTFSKAE